MGRRHAAADWRELIDQALAVTWPDLPDGWRWIVAQVQAESAGDLRAVSPVGAQGLLQLMPATAAELGVTNPFDPAENLHGGITYLKRQYGALGEVPQEVQRLLWSFAAFNAGRGYVDSCLVLAKREAPNDWWLWDVGRRWLPDVVFRGRRPDHKQVWFYVDRIRLFFEGMKP